MPDVKFYEIFKEEEKFLKKFLPCTLKVAFSAKTIQASGDKITPAGIISIRTQSKIPLSWTDDGLKAVLSRSQGYDHLVTFLSLKQSKVVCGYLKTYCARAVGEHAIFAAMALMRKFKLQVKNFETFNREGLTGFECAGRRALIIGVGKIGSEIVDVARGLKMQAKGVDVVRRMKRLPYISLKEGVRWADIIFCALPLTRQTDKMLDYKILKNVKAGCIFVNVARAEISPIRGLKRLLDEGKMGGLSLDVYPQEGAFADYLRKETKKLTPEGRIVLELSKRNNTFFTPHNAFNTHESVERKALLTAASIKHFLRYKRFPCQVV